MDLDLNNPLSDENKIKERIGFLRNHVQDLAHLNDREFAKAYSDRHQDDKTLSGFAAEGFSRPLQIKDFYRGVDELGSSAGQGLFELTGGQGEIDAPSDGNLDWWRRVIARGMGGMVSNSPEMALAALPGGKVAQVAGAGLSGVSSYMHEKARDGDTMSASGAAAGQVASGAIANWLQNRFAIPKTLGGNLTAGFASRLIADIPTVASQRAYEPNKDENGDIIGYTELEGTDRVVKNLKDNFNITEEEARKRLAERVVTDTAFGVIHHFKQHGLTKEATRLNLVDQAAVAGPLANPTDKAFYEKFGISPNSNVPQDMEVKQHFNEWLGDMKTVETEFRAAPVGTDGKPTAEAYKVLNSGRTKASEAFAAKVAQTMKVPMTEEQAANYTKAMTARMLRDEPITGGVEQPTGASSAAASEASVNTNTGSEPKASGDAAQAAPGGVVKQPSNFFKMALLQSQKPDGYLPSTLTKTVGAADVYKYMEGAPQRIAGNFLKSLVHTPSHFTIHNGETLMGRPDTIGLVSLDDGKIHLSFGGKNNLTSQIGLLAEEGTHYSTLGYSKTNPEAFANYDAHINSFSSEQRLGFLKAYAKELGLNAIRPDFDFNYYAGHGLDHEGKAFSREHVTYEFIGGLARMYHEAVMNGYKPSLAKLEQTLPQQAFRLLKNAILRVNSLIFGEDEMGSMWSDRSRKKMEAIFEHTKNDVIKNELFEYSLMRTLDKLDATGFDGIGKQVFTPEASYRAAYEMRSATPASKAIGEVAKAIGAARSGEINGIDHSGLKGKFEKMFLFPLQYSSVYRQARPVYDVLFGFMGKTKEKTEEHMALLGGFGQNGVTREQGIKSATELLSYYHGDLSAVNRLGKAFGENQKRRDFPGFTVDKLLSPKELQSKFNMSVKESEYASKLLRLTDHVSHSTLEGIQERNKTLFAQNFYSHNPQLGFEGALKAGQLMLKPSAELGILQYQKEQAAYNLRNMPEESPQRKQLQGLINSYQKQIDSYRDGVFNTMMQFMPPGTDPKSIQVGADLLHAKMLMSGFDAVQWTKLTEKQGYAPQTRNGKFIAIAVQPNGEKVTYDHDDRKKVQAKMAEWQTAGFSDITEFNKAEYQKKFSHSHVDDIQRLADSQNKLLQGLVEKLKLKYIDNPDVVSTLQELSTYYDAPDKDVSASMSVKGDVYKMKRENVSGFNEGDYLGNVLNYTKYRVAKTQRDLAKAQIGLHMLDKFYVENPDVHEQVKTHINFVLGATDNEWSQFRNWLNVTYVGGSLKQLTMNGFQQIYQGLPVLTERYQATHGASSPIAAAKVQAKAAWLLKKWALKGTTGDVLVDHLMAVAKKDGKTTPAAIEADLPTSIEDFQHFTKMGQLIRDGHTGSLKVDKALLEASHAKVATLALLRKTAAAGEMANRNMSMLTGILAGREIGIKDPRQLYEFASQYNDEVNFIGDKSNRPRAIGQLTQLKDSNLYGAGTTLLTLRSFQLNYLGQLYALYQSGKLGAWDYVEGKRLPEQKSRAAFWTAMGVIGSFSGAAGLVGAEDLDEFIKSKNEGKGLQHYLGKGTETLAGFLGADEFWSQKVAQLAQRGAIWSATGVDTTDAGLGKLINYNSSPTATVADNVWNAAGPAPGFLKQMYNAADTFVGEDPINTLTHPIEAVKLRGELAARQGAPTALKQMLRMNDIATYGAPRNSMLDPTSPTPLGFVKQMGSLFGYKTAEQHAMEENKSMKEIGDKSWQEFSNTKAKDVATALGNGDEKTAKAIAEAVFTKQFERGEENAESFIRNVAEAVYKTKHATVKASTPSNWKAYAPVDSSTGKLLGSVPYRSELELSQLTAEIAVKLGAPEVAKAILSPVGLRQKARADILGQTTQMSPGQVKAQLQKPRAQHRPETQDESSSE